MLINEDGLLYKESFQINNSKFYVILCKVVQDLFVPFNEFYLYISERTGAVRYSLHRRMSIRDSSMRLCS